jgi:hypothetical protein
MSEGSYTNGLLYGAAGFAVGTLTGWTPTERLSPRVFWMLLGAGYGIATAPDDENPKRKDPLPIFNYFKPYSGQDK